MTVLEDNIRFNGSCLSRDLGFKDTEHRACGIQEVEH